MSSTIPHMATVSLAEPDGRPAPARDETSLHDEILARLREQIAQGRPVVGAGSLGGGQREHVSRRGQEQEQQRDQPDARP
jgi:hypothetical protein